ncbi:hypothetical protein BH09BAC4_BH09BAC4_13210 [soil metagenome]
MHWNRFQSHLWRLLVSGWLMVACTAPEDERPDNLIAQDKMVDILTEVHIAESQVSRLSLGSLDSSNIAYKHLENQIFRKFAVDTAMYRKSYIFYSSHPSDMEAIYKQVTERLKQRADTTKSKQPKKS